MVTRSRIDADPCELGIQAEVAAEHLSLHRDQQETMLLMLRVAPELRKALCGWHTDRSFSSSIVTRKGISAMDDAAHLGCC
jgi:hypothetical protein